MFHAIRFGLIADMLAEEIILLGRRQRCMTVGRPDHAELIRIGAELGLEG